MSARKDSPRPGPGVVGRLVVRRLVTCRQAIGRSGRKRDERGAMLILAASGLVLAMVFAALAVDIGFLAADKRTDQKLADLAAMDASRDLTNIQALAEASVARNYVSQRDAFPTTVAQLVSKDPVTGEYAPDLNGTFVRVTVTSPREPFFPFVSGSSRTVKAVGVAGAVDEGSFSLGSGLANLNTSKSILDQLIGSMIKTPGTVSLLSYQGLANSTISLSALQTQLLAQGLAVGSTDELMNTNLTMAQLLSATATGLSGPASATLDVNQLATKVGPVGTVKLADFVTLAQPSGAAALDTQINVFRFVNGAAQVANGASAISIPSVSVTIPNVTSVGLTVNMIEKPDIFIGSPTAAQPHANTSQLTVTLTPTVSVLGTGVTFPLTVTAASATGNLTAVGCGTPKSITVVADTSGANASANITASILTIPLPVNISLNSNLGNPPPFAPETFTYPGQFGPTGSRTLGSDMLSLGDPSVLTASTGNAITDLAVNSAVLPVLRPAIAAIDAEILRPILKSLGVSLGTATIEALPIPPNGVNCGSVKLLK